MKVSEYHEQGVDCDLESVGYVTTTCKTVGEFVKDAMDTPYKDNFEFTFQRPVKVRMPGGKFYIMSYKTAFLKFTNRKQTEESNFDEIKDEPIHWIDYRDGWWGLYFKITLKGKDNDIQREIPEHGIFNA